VCCKKDRASASIIEKNCVGDVGSKVRDVSRKRNVHHGPSKKHVRRRINTLDPSTRRVLLLEGGIVVTMERAEETTVIFNVRINGTRKSIRVHAVAVGFVVLLGVRVIDDKGIRLGVALIKPTTSYFWFLVTFRHNQICGLAVAFKHYFFGISSRASKKNPQNGRHRELLPNANNVIRPPPPIPPLPRNG